MQRRAVVGHQPLQIERPHHVHPQPADLVAGHVAAVECLQGREVGSQRFHRNGGVHLLPQGTTHIAGEERPRHGVVVVEGGLGVEKVGRQGAQFRIAQVV